MSAPVIPQRPARSLNKQSAATAAPMAAPAIPPRPKRFERSTSPDRFARSPLNEPVFSKGNNGSLGSSLQKKISASELPKRPPSVTLPSIGQEGNEYANLHEFHSQSEDTAAAPAQERQVSGDLPLHAPKAITSPEAAKTRIATVTRTDSQQAAAAGIGRAYDQNDKGATEYARSSSSLGGNRSSRPASLYKDDEEHGIPSFGVTVPMYPNAGDVQAPTPSPGLQSGFNLHNNGAPSLRHQRTRSGREVFTGPPGSYGLHGHGLSADPFEKEWYKKHPEAHAREIKGEYGPAIAEHRPEWALSSDELNNLVHGGSRQGSTSPTVVGVPDEEIGYMASEEYSSRYASPRPPSAQLGKPRSTSNQMHQESPLRKMSFPVEEVDEALKLPGKARPDQALEDETDDDAIHVDPPSRRHSRIGGGGYDISTEDLSRGGNVEEQGGWPILASDEVAKHPESEWLQPAVPPEDQKRGSYYAGVDADGNPVYQSGSRGGSRPTSRNNSLHEGPNILSRFASHDQREGTGTPLEDVKEYEPLFPEDDERKVQKPKTAADKLKRPDLARHHFPSQDIWEDTPTSLQLQTTVESPQLPEEPTSTTTATPAAVFESPEAEAARKAHLTKKDQENFLSDHTKRLAKTHLKPSVMADMPTRPGMQQRFPSQDIWEDTPSSLMDYTTVGSPQVDEPKSAEEPKAGGYLESKDLAEEEPHRPHDEIDNPLESSEVLKSAKPQIPARPERKGHPAIPTRPHRTSSASEKDGSPVDRKVPVIPDRPKPQIPARPAKARGSGSSERIPLAKTISAGSAGSEGAADREAPAVPKAKPAVPARPPGSKIAALQSGFMKDLNSRLKLGPQAPLKAQEEGKPEEEPKEKAPLADARKGRARGPQRRKPGVSPAAAPVEESQQPKPELSFSIAAPTSVWQIVDGGNVELPVSKAKAPSTEETETSVQADAPPELKEPIEAKALDTAIGAKEPEPPMEMEDSLETVKPVEEPSSKDAVAADSPEMAAKEFPEVAAEEPTETPEKQNLSVQTGQQDVEFNIDDKKEKMTAFLRGRAQEEGNVVVEDGEEISKGIDATGDSLKTGDGM